MVRIREQRGRPYCFVVTYMPLEIADRIDWKRLGARPVITAAVQAGYPFVKTEQVISATVADEEAAKALGIPIGSPLSHDHLPFSIAFVCVGYQVVGTFLEFKCLA